MSPSAAPDSPGGGEEGGSESETAAGDLDTSDTLGSLLAAKTIPGPVEVQVLGAVRVTGAVSPITSQEALGLVCYLALHRDGMAVGREGQRLWQGGSRPPSPRRLANLASLARVCLGDDADGRPYLSHLGRDGVYRLSSRVTTDLERFRAWRRAAEGVSPQESLEFLKAALCLVRGLPFGGGGGDVFSWMEALWRPYAENLVDATAHRLADMATALGLVSVARWSVQRGLAVSPDCAECHQRRLALARCSGRLREASLVAQQVHRLRLEPFEGSRCRSLRVG